MKDGYSSGIYGATLEIINNGTRVPDWKSGAFVDNEMWTAFHDIPNSWVEVGSEVGAARGSETTPEAFYAFQNQVESSYREYLVPVSLPAGQWFWVETLYVGNGVWEAYIEGAGPYQMVVNLPGGADSPENGLEMTASNITNSGATRSPVWEGPSGHWQYGWYDSYSTAYRAAHGWQNFGNWAGYETAPTCAQPTGTPGAITFSSYPYPNPDPQSCFTGDHQNYEDIITAPLSAATETLSGGVAEPNRPPSQQPPVVASDWPGVAPQTGTPLSKAQLTGVVQKIAAEQGDADPTDIQAVATERGAGLSATNPGAKLPDTSGSQAWETALKTWYGQKAYLVTLHGEFTGNVSTPAGDTTPTGSVLTLILDAYTGKITMMGLNKTQPSLDMSSLGPVEEL
jgi:hypothetical protein